VKILIDGEEVKLEVQPKSFPELLSQVSNVCNERRRVITLMHADTRRVYSGNQLPNGLPFENLTLLEVTTGPSREVATGVLRGCGEHLAQLSDAFADTSSMLRGGATQEGMSRLVEAINLWLELAGGTESAMHVVGLEWGSVQVHDVNAAEGVMVSAERIVGRLNEILEEVQKAIEDQDTLELVDILEYDLPPILKGYQEALFKMAEIASKPVN
jgi:hypothetical protein